MSLRTLAAAVAAALASSHGAHAQDAGSHRDAFPSGISVQYGLGRTALKDEFLSPERYTGSFPQIVARWSRYHGGHGFEIGIEFRRSTDVRNYNASATLTQFALRQGFLYPLPEFRLAGRTVHAYVGPTAELFLLLNEQHVAVANPNFNLSPTVLLSLGAASRAVLPLGARLRVESELRLGVLSLGVRPMDPDDDEGFPGKLLTPLNGTNAAARIGLGYRLNGHLAGSLSGGFHLLRVGAWAPLVAASNDVALGLTVGF